MRKRTIILISTLLIFNLSCKKENKTITLDLNNGDYFIFGSYAGECYGDCAHFYVIKDSSIYADDNINYFYSDSLKFKTTPLNTDKYYLAKPILNNFPAYFNNHKNETFGCPDCTDGGAIYILLKKDDIISNWNIDNFIENQPVEIRSYISELHSVLTELQ